MGQVGRPGLSKDHKQEIWRRWKEGWSLSEIGRLLGTHPGSVHGVVAANGGYVPAQRQRSTLALTVGEREEISRGLAAGQSFRAIAARLGRSASTVSREVRRNGGPKSYRAQAADIAAWQRSRRPKRPVLARNSALCDIVAAKLACDWSPQQIAGYLRVTYTNQEEMQVSHETIYKSLFIQTRGVLKKELIAHLRSRRTMRRAKNATTAGQTRGQIKEAVSIRQRPAEVADRAVPGHWEGDLITGSKNSHIATLVERHSRFLILVRLNGKDTASVVTALTRRALTLPDQMMKSLTWDRGTELADHQRFTLATNINVYFCDPKSPWQRGSNENTNGLLRQYFPKKTDLAAHTQADLDTIAVKLNTRPRKTLHYTTPADTLFKAVASTP